MVAFVRRLVVASLLGSLLVACGVNLFESMVSKTADRYYFEEAKAHLNAGDYPAAQSALDKIPGTSNDKVLLQVAINLGAAGLSFWEIMLDLVDQVGSGSSGSGGMEQVFSLLSDSVFGEGSDRTSRINALNASVATIVNAPDPTEKNMTGFRCFLSGILVLPTVKDGTKAMTEASTALDNLAASVEGLGDNAQECPGLDAFEKAMSDVSKVQESLAFVLKQTTGCTMLDFLQNTGSLNEVQTKLKKFVAAADQGCATVSCTSSVCRALQLGCVQESLADTTAKKGDGQVNRCELIYNCREPGSCF